MRVAARNAVLVAGLVAGSAVLSGQVRATPVLTDDPMQVRVIPAGAQVEVMLKTPVNSSQAKLDERFDATLLENYELQGRVVLTAGSMVRGFISSVRSWSKTVQHGQITLSFDALQAGDATLRLRASVVGVFDPREVDQLSRIGASPAVGARTGSGHSPLGTVRVNDGGTIMSTKGTDVILPAGTVLRLRLDQPLEVPVTR